MKHVPRLVAAMLPLLLFTACSDSAKLTALQTDNRKLSQQLEESLKEIASTRDAGVRELEKVRGESKAQVEAEQAVVSALKEEVRVSGEQAEALRKELENQPAPVAAREWDLLTLTNGAQMVGVVREWRGDRLTVESPDGSVLNANPAQLASVKFRQAGLTPDSPLARASAPVATPAATPLSRAAAPASPAPVLPAARAVPTAPPSAAAPPGPPQPTRLEVEVVKRKNPSRTGATLDFDDQQQVVTMEVRVANKDTVRALGKVSVEIWVIAEAAAGRGDYLVVNHETHALELGKNQTQTFSTTPKRLEFDQSNYAKYGYKFYGYYLEVTQDGTLLTTKSSPSRLEKVVKSFRALRDESTFRL